MSRMMGKNDQRPKGHVCGHYEPGVCVQDPLPKGRHVEKREWIAEAESELSPIPLHPQEGT